ncbi:MAG: class I SAM-dependent methyltransferase [Clostridiales bacterium]
MGINSIKEKIMSKSRSRKYKLFIDFIKSSAPSKNIENITILDVGVNTVEYSSVDNYLEKHYPYSKNITALSVTEPEDFPLNYPEVRLVQYYGSTFPFCDKEYDFVHSNAVIEHVGNLEKQKFFLSELIRVSKYGVFFTTPNKLFPIEIHTNILFLHYLPKKSFDKILQILNKSWATGDYMYLLSEQDLIKLKCSINSHSYENFIIKKERMLGLTYQLIGLLKR